MKIMVVSILALPFFRCSTTGTITSLHITNELYIYHNGIDTIVKDYEHYKWLKLTIEKEGLQVDTTQNWTPKIDESSRFVYYQIINRKILYKQYSTFIDSTIIKNFELGQNINSEKREISPLPWSDSIYTDIQEIMNNNESIVNTYRFTDDSLYIKMEFISNRETPIYFYDSYKYGVLNYYNEQKSDSIILD